MIRTNALCCTVLLLVSGCASRIQHGLDERDANEIITALAARGLEARKVPEKGKRPTWAIELEEARAAEALRLLAELKLPRPQRLKTQALAQTSGLIDTPAAERLRQLEAQEGDLEETLETLDGVASASIELVVPPAPRPGQPVMPSKASVLVRARPDAVERLQQQKAELQALVAAAVDGLRAEDVVLVFDVVALQASVPREEKQSYRLVIFALAVALSVVAALLVFVAWRLRLVSATQTSPGTPVAQPAPPPAPARPVVNPAIQRKAA
jgi:type III secretion protein J